MPNLDNIRLWVAALRSGEYTQGMEALRNLDNDTWCCLGVACDVAMKNGVVLGLDSMLTIDGDVAMYDGSADYLPESVRRWLGIPSRNPVLDGFQATAWNDEFGASFSAIADLIDTEFLTEREEIQA